jgi:RNA polymerase sigma-70 factor (ECF subfamily)
MKTDSELVAAFQAGQIEALGELYDRYVAKIYRFVYYKTQHKESAEDIISSVFFKVNKNLVSFDNESGTFQAWLYRIARNAIIDFYRSRKDERGIEDIWGLSDNKDVARDTDIRIALEKIDVYLSALSAEQREIIILRLWQGLSHGEIAELMGKSEASIKMSFSRSLRELRQAMPADLLVTLLLLGTFSV